MARKNSGIRFVSVTELRHTPRRYVQRAARGARFVITKRGEPVALLGSYAEYKATEKELVNIRDLSLFTRSRPRKQKRAVIRTPHPSTPYVAKAMGVSKKRTREIKGLMDRIIAERDLRRTKRGMRRRI